MPLYEYRCEPCDHVFERLRPLHQSNEPSACPTCGGLGSRIVGSGFLALTMRDGYARQIPDRGTYWHLGKEVSRMHEGGSPAFSHPELKSRDE